MATAAPANTTLEATAREGQGKGPARRTRMAGLVPAIVYGKHLAKPLQIAVNAKAVKAAINTPKRLNTVLTLKVGAAAHTVLLKDYQQDPVSMDLLHADFIEVRENEQVKVKLPVVLVGKAEGVATGGILAQIRRDIEVWALPKAIPDKLEVDVTPLKVGMALHINDIKLPAGVTVKTHVNYTLATVTIPEAEVVATPVAAAAVPGAEGAAPAEGAAAGAAPAAGAKPGEKAPAGDAKAAAPAKADAKKK
ncbi:MAG: 50S ribosomal protein L25 [Myxococcaceae bacterium]